MQGLNLIKCFMLCVLIFVFFRNQCSELKSHISFLVDCFDFRWNFPMAPTCVGTNKGTRESSLTSAGFARRDFSARIIWQSISRRTQKPYHIIVRYAIEAFNGKSRCELTFRMNMLDNMIWWRHVHYVVIVLERWNHCEFISSIDMEST